MKKRPGRKPVDGESKLSVFQIRTTDKEKEIWAEKAQKLGYKSVADMFRKLMASA